MISFRLSRRRWLSQASAACSSLARAELAVTVILRPAGVSFIEDLVGVVDAFERAGEGDHIIVAHDRGGGPAFHAQACKLELEGIVSKRADAAYAQGRPDIRHQLRQPRLAVDQRQGADILSVESIALRRSAPHAEEPMVCMTHRWRGESRANSSRN